MYFESCPRCGYQAFENLKTHSHCSDCGYGAVHETHEPEQIPQWALDFLMAADSVPKEAIHVSEAA